VKQFRKYLFRLLLFGLLLLFAGFIILKTTDFNILLSDIAVLIFFFTIITLTTLAVFFRGQSREPASQTLHSLFSVSIKFLMELILTLIWLIVLKKTAMSLVIMFFLIYLAFSSFLLIVVLITLKNRLLQNKY
jgi:hypothetical protein